MKHTNPAILVTTTTTTFFFVLFFLVINHGDIDAAQLPGAAATGGGCLPHEREALLAFKEGITGDPMGLVASWQQENNCCRWRGVRCSSRAGASHVVELQLRNDADPEEDNGYDSALVGWITPSLLSLEHLERLDLSRNNLTGPGYRLPEFLGSLKSLRYLNLSDVPFTGMVPPQLGNLSKLEYLDLSAKALQIMSLPGMYSRDITWLKNLPLLQHLSLNFVNLSTVDGWPHAINMLPSLRELSLSLCSLGRANHSFLHLNLTKLDKVDLSENIFNHPVASAWVWNVTRLKYLNLRLTGLYGQLPDAVLGDKMTSLQVLDLSYNHNMGIMAADLRNLCDLEILDLTQTLPSGDITELFDNLTQCSSRKLAELYLGGNNITGKLPQWMGILSSLVTLDLSGNHLTGHVPSGIATLTNLTNFDLRDNNLDGVITGRHLAGLRSLKNIGLSHNSLKVEIDPEWSPPFSLEYGYFDSCHMGPNFPAWLQSQVGILKLVMSNTSIHDTLLHWFCTTFSQAAFVDMSNNRIGGELPTCMGTMSLEQLYLSSNQIVGQLPVLPSSLEILDMSSNSLSGPLPRDFGTPNLVALDLFSNHFNGHIPASMCELQFLFALDLSNNLMDGEIPDCSSSGIRFMMYLRLSNNSFYGKFPSTFLQNCPLLNFVDLTQNKFSGILPTWIGEFSQLSVLRVSNNMLSGNIPAGITELRHLYHLDLASNRLSGAIPSDLSNLKAMTLQPSERQNNTVVISGVEYISPVTTKGQRRLYDQENVEVVTIDLSSNSLTGGIPESIASLDGLVNLNLSLNHLSGKIPDKIGSMKSLQSLDFSRNMLSGEIPRSISQLTYLSYLDLSYNNLTGMIPSGSQLDTLYDQHPYMYNGNSGLCGPPLRKNCSSNGTPKQGRSAVTTRRGSRIDPFFFGLVLGFIAGLWLVFCAMLLKKSWRIAYFRFFDKLCDKVYVIMVVGWGRLTRRTLTN